MAVNTPVVGKIVWHDLITTEVETALKFYEDIFSWNYRQGELSSTEKYHMIRLGEKNIGGFRKPVLDNVPPHWVAYVTVQDVDKSAEHVKELGGKIIVGPKDIPNVGRFAVSIDPQGAAIDLFKGDKEESPEQPQRQIGGFCWDECLTDDPEAAKKYYGKIFGWSFKEMEMGQMGTYWVARPCPKSL